MLSTYLTRDRNILLMFNTNFPGAAAVAGGVGAVPADLRHHLQLLLTPHVRGPSWQGSGKPLRSRGGAPGPQHHHAGAHPEKVSRDHESPQVADELPCESFKSSVNFRRTVTPTYSARASQHCELVNSELLRELEIFEIFNFHQRPQSPVSTARPPDCDNLSNLENVAEKLEKSV